MVDLRKRVTVDANLHSGRWWDWRVENSMPRLRAVKHLDIFQALHILVAALGALLAFG